jgi:YVTN family beta-propeller protein
MSACPKASWPWVKTMLHSVYDQPDTASVHAQFDRLVAAVADKLPKGPGPGGAATNPLTNTLYITHYGANMVSVVNGRTNTVTTTLPVGSGPIRVATNPATNTTFVTNSADNTVSVIKG